MRRRKDGTVRQRRRNLGHRISTGTSRPSREGRRHLKWRYQAYSRVLRCSHIGWQDLLPRLPGFSRLVIASVLSQRSVHKVVPVFRGLNRQSRSMQKGLSSGCEIGRMGDLVDPFLDAGEETGSDSFVGKDAEPAKGKLSGAYGWHGCPEQEGPQDRREPGLRCGGGNHRYSPEKVV